MMIKLRHAKSLQNIEVKTKLEELNQSSTRAIADILAEQVNTAMAQMQGFAFGGGLERLLMVRYGIPEVRYFHSGDVRFNYAFQK